MAMTALARYALVLAGAVLLVSPTPTALASPHSQLTPAAAGGPLHTSIWLEDVVFTGSWYRLGPLPPFSPSWHLQPKLPASWPDGEWGDWGADGWAADGPGSPPYGLIFYDPATSNPGYRVTTFVNTRDQASNDCAEYWINLEPNHFRYHGVNNHGWRSEAERPRLGAIQHLYLKATVDLTLSVPDDRPAASRPCSTNYTAVALGLHFHHISDPLDRTKGIFVQMSLVDSRGVLGPGWHRPASGNEHLITDNITNVFGKAPLGTSVTEDYSLDVAAYLKARIQGSTDDCLDPHGLDATECDVWVDIDPDPNNYMLDAYYLTPIVHGEGKQILGGEGMDIVADTDPGCPP